jgi:predicted nuclease of restriction endonuclease-like (RecB) superfamily
MKENEYYNEIESYIKRNEINKKRRILEENYDTLNNYWNIGKLIVEAQGGKIHAKRGEELIKKWSIQFTKKYGKGYDATNLRKFRQFYLEIPKCATLWRVSWSIIKIVLPIKDINRRNYYFNLSVEQNLSVRQLQEKIKSNSYERLINKPINVELIISKKEYTILEDIKNTIIIKVDKNKIIKSEKDLELTILSEITFVLTQLGRGFAFIGNQYKINNYYIDILLFNIELNSYVVIELKTRRLKVEDKAQVEMYMKLVDENIKKSTQNKTIGIIISKEQDDYVANFVRSNDLIPLTYEVINN